MKELIIFTIGFLGGNVSLACWALCAANTMYEEKRRKAKTNEDMLKLSDGERLREGLKRMCSRLTVNLSPMLKEEQGKRIDEWLEKEVDPEWKD